MSWSFASRFNALGPFAILVATIINPLLIGTGNLPAIAGGAATLGAGFGLCYSFISLRVVGAFDDASRARGSSAISTACNSGGAAGAATAALAANAFGFSESLAGSNIHLIARDSLGSAIPFAFAALCFAVRVAKAPVSTAFAVSPHPHAGSVLYDRGGERQPTAMSHS